MSHFSPDVIKAAIAPEHYFGDQLPAMKQSKRQGWSDGGLCPFHADKHSGNFRVNTETGAYCCFACGAKGGDIIAFHRALYALSFPDALKDLANLYLPEGGQDHE